MMGTVTDGTSVDALVTVEKSAAPVAQRTKHGTRLGTMTVAIMVCAVLTGCSTHRKIEKTTDIKSEATELRKDSASRMIIDTLSSLMKKNEHLHLVIYDTDKPIEGYTGRHPVKAELWRDNDEIILNQERCDERTEITTVSMEHEDVNIRQQEEKETEVKGMETKLMWWWIASAIIILAAGIIELKQKK